MVSFGYHWKDEPASRNMGDHVDSSMTFDPSPKPSQSPSKELGRAVGGAGFRGEEEEFGFARRGD